MKIVLTLSKSEIVGNSSEVVRDVLESLRKLTNEHPRKVGQSVNNVFTRLHKDPNAAHKLSQDGDFKRLCSLFKSRLQFDLEGALDKAGDSDSARNTYLLGAAPLARRSKKHNQARIIKRRQQVQQVLRVDKRMDDDDDGHDEDNNENHNIDVDITL